MKRCENELCATRFEIVEQPLCGKCLYEKIFVEGLKWARNDVLATKHRFVMGGQGPCRCDRCEETQELANRIQVEIDRRLAMFEKEKP